MSPLVSIIIPVYNVDKILLQSCLKSVINQSYENIEVIIVNDGSADDTLVYCQQVAQNENKVTVINQHNQGVSAARNNGTIKAKGDYILYVDGDDVLSSFAVENGVNYINSTGCDLVIAAVKKIFSHRDFDCNRKESDSYEVFTIDDFDVLKRHFVGLNNKKFLGVEGTGYINRGPYCRLIKKEIAIANSFPGGIPIGEDLIWNMNLLDKCKTICVAYQQWYGYLTNSSSAIRKYYGNRREVVEQYLNILYDSQTKFCQNNPEIVAKNVGVELYCLLKYEYMSPKCKLNVRQKNKKINNCLESSPWSILNKKHIKKSLSRKYQIMLFLCKVQLWQPAFKLIYRN